MGKADLSGRSILVLEDEPLIALDIAESLKSAGANVITAGQLSVALRRAADSDLSAAVLDYKLNDGDTAELCRLLKDRRVPFLFYSGYSGDDFVRRQWPDVIIIEKPAVADKISAAVTALVARDVTNVTEVTTQSQSSAAQYD
jgi:DNA-binding response OmpR family regulator